MLVLLLERYENMKETDIRKYAKLMTELGLSGLEITEESGKVRLERTQAVPLKETVSVLSPQEKGEEAVEEKKDYISVRSPLVGVFYAAPAENAAPYIAIGDNIQKGQILCIIEAMKLMNEITAEDAGEIMEICVTNGQVVEYGTELFRIKR